MRQITIITAFLFFAMACGNKSPDISVMQTCTKACGSTFTNTVTPSGGTPPYVISWDGGKYGVFVGDPFVVNPRVVGTQVVTATVTDDNGCTSTATNRITVTGPCCTCDLDADYSAYIAALSVGEVAYLEDVTVTLCDATVVNIFSYGDVASTVLLGSNLVTCSAADAFSGAGLDPINQLETPAFISSAIETLCGTGPISFFSLDGSAFFLQMCAGCIETVDISIGIVNETSPCSSSSIDPAPPDVTSDTNALCCD